MKQVHEEIDQARKSLGLGESASLKEIKKAYRSLSRKWHPDKCKKNDAKKCNEKMKEINHAYKLIMKYIEGYNFSFTEEKVCEDSPEARWKKQFGKDPIWGEKWG